MNDAPDQFRPTHSPDFKNNSDRVDEFVERFKMALSRCVQKGFLVEDVFTVIWEETLDDICLAAERQAAVYNSLLSWANQRLKSAAAA